MSADAPKVEWPATGEELRAAGYRSTGGWRECPTCKARIVWARTPYGRVMPIEEAPLEEGGDGVRRFRAHFVSCVQWHVARLAAAKRAKEERRRRG